MPNKRPWFITLICILGVLGLLAAIPALLSDAGRTIAQNIGPWYLPYAIVSIVIGLAAIVGLWMMKKWSIILYTVFALINQIVLLIAGSWNIYALILPAIIVAIGFSQYKSMK